MAEGNLLEFTDSNFSSDVEQSDIPVVVDFWAPWCGPCRMVTPIMQELADKYQGKVKIGKMNVDENPETASQMGISSIPAVFVFKNGQRVDQQIGAAPKGAFEQMIDRHI